MIISLSYTYLVYIRVHIILQLHAYTPLKHFMVYTHTTAHVYYSIHRLLYIYIHPTTAPTPTNRSRWARPFYWPQSAYQSFPVSASFLLAPIRRASLSSFGHSVILCPKPPQNAHPFTPFIFTKSSSGSCRASKTGGTRCLASMSRCFRSSKELSSTSLLIKVVATPILYS